VARVVAGAIDLAVAFGLVVLALAALRRLPLPLGLLLSRSPVRWLPFFLPSLYLIAKDSIGGKSLGKLVTGLVVWDRTAARPAGFFDSVNRNWPIAIPILGPTVFALVVGVQIVRGSERRLGDRGNTVVLSDAESLAAPCPTA
jgi:hypothetical protein